MCNFVEDKLSPSNDLEDRSVLRVNSAGLTGARIDAQGTWEHLDVD